MSYQQQSLTERYHKTSELVWALGQEQYVILRTDLNFSLFGCERVLTLFRNAYQLCLKRNSQSEHWSEIALQTPHGFFTMQLRHTPLQDNHPRLVVSSVCFSQISQTRLASMKLSVSAASLGYDILVCSC